MTPRAEVAHSLPGRMRLRIPERCKDEAYFSQLATALAAMPEVSNAKVNPMAASVTIEFDGDAGAVADEAAARDLFRVEKRDVAMGARVSDAMEAPLHLVSGRDIGPMFLAGTLFAAIGLAQAVRGRILVPATSAFWYAAQAFGQRASTPPTKKAPPDR